MTDAFAQTAFSAAAVHIQGAVRTAAEQLADVLAQVAPPVGVSRQSLALLQGELRRKLPAFHGEFATALREKLQAATMARSDLRRAPISTSWESLSLVDDNEVDERVAAERISMEMAHDCEWQLRELDGYVGALVPAAAGDPAARNPLRTEVIAEALMRAIHFISSDVDERRLLGREFGRALAPLMRACYTAISADLRDKGVRTAGLAVRGVQGPGNELPREVLRENSAYQTSGYRTSGFGSASATGRDTPVGASNSAGAPLAGSSYSGARNPRSASASPAEISAAADAHMLDMLRRLANLNLLAAESNFAVAGTALASGAPGGVAPSGGAAGGGLQAVNLIRAHRDELVRASSGALDHMVIDVVGAMFDHLLSDSKVPPQLARQIARLQMPVLRAALKDMEFFSSRRHPVRRFVNRIASLALAYEDLEQGPGRAFIERVQALVQEIVEGDFDQMEPYESKLHAIEALIQEQSRRDVGTHATAAVLLDGKETQLRIQQRYMLQLREKLEPLELPPYLSDFLSQVWSQVQVQIAATPGADLDLLQRMLRTPHDLVMSIQPKGEPQLRKAFLMKLPQLMKDVNEGLALIRWPEPAKKEFYGHLLPAHAGSLKQAPLTDFAQRQLKHKLEQLGKVTIPTEDDLRTGGPAPLPPGNGHAAALQFSPEEVQRIGLVEESAVDWNGVIDIDLGEVSVNSTSGLDTASDAISMSGVDIDIEAQAAADGAPPTHGPQLIHHLQTGIAYRMHVEGRWQRVRLNWVSPGHAFFVFTHGKSHEKTLSMTARMLTRLCETERFRSFEQAELIERATARARKQLAQLTAASRHGALGTRH